VADGETFRLSAPGDPVTVLLHPPGPLGEGFVRFDVQLVGSGLDARCAVETLSGDIGFLTRPVVADGDRTIHRERSLSRLLGELGRSAGPWDGSIGWWSLEGTFVVEASCDALGHVTMTVTLEPRTWEPPWTITVTVNHVLGDLLPLADRLSHWFDTHV
jgi:hypothetical protein